MNVELHWTRLLGSRLDPPKKRTRLTNNERFSNIYSLYRKLCCRLNVYARQKGSRRVELNFRPPLLRLISKS